MRRMSSLFGSLLLLSLPNSCCLEEAAVFERMAEEIEYVPRPFPWAWLGHCSPMLVIKFHIPLALHSPRMSFLIGEFR